MNNTFSLRRFLVFSVLLATGFSGLVANLLHDALKEKNFNLEEFKRLLSEKKSLIDQVDSSKGETPLFKAVQRELDDAVRLLLEAGAKVNVKNKDKDTPLHFAVYSESNKITDMLIKSGADKEAVNNEGLTPVFYAVKEKKPENVEYLIKAKVNLNITDNYGRNLFHVVGDFRTAQLLVNANPGLLNKKDKDQCTPLHRKALQSNSSLIVALFIISGADLKLTNSSGLSVIDAFRRSNEEHHCFWLTNSDDPVAAAKKILKDYEELADKELKESEKKPAGKLASVSGQHGKATGNTPKKDKLSLTSPKVVAPALVLGVLGGVGVAVRSNPRLRNAMQAKLRTVQERFFKTRLGHWLNRNKVADANVNIDLNSQPVDLGMAE